MKNVNSDIAYDYIRKRILNGEYAPGHDLATNTLSGVIGVSRTPVRDALRQLEADGLVTIQPRLGASVKSMELKEFRETCGLRLALESYAAGLAATNRTESDLQEISFALEAMRKLTGKIIGTKQEDPILGELRREDVRFHIAVMTAAKNDLMKKEILRLHLINRVVSSPSALSMVVALTQKDIDDRRRAVFACHQEIFDAIKRSDAVAAKLSMEKHIQDIIDSHLRIMAQSEAGVAKELTEEEMSYSV